MKTYTLLRFKKVATAQTSSWVYDQPIARSETISKTNEKRVSIESNYQTCLDSFDVHKDKIIRTQASRDMGAKYLNEIDVDSRQECLKYCCDTDRCDVFVFEERKPGSCYLFQCGPLHEFKCKFTNHANYTSAVRTNYNAQSNAQLEDIRISQQEHELKLLRKLNEPGPGEYSLTEQHAKLNAPFTPKLVLITPSPVKPTCNWNQYECRSSGVCIAIYNVCDGIPQCADGSDEAADLVCPTEKPTTSASIIQSPPPAPPADVIKYQQMINQRKSLAPLYARVPETNLKPWELPNIAHQVMSQQQSLVYPGQQLDIPQLRKGYGPLGDQWDYQPVYDQNKDIYNTRNSFREQNNLDPYKQDQLHIFNHKGSSVIGENVGDRGTWQEIQVQPSPSIASNLEHKQMVEIEKSTKGTTTPLCDTSDEHKEEVVRVKEDDKSAKKIEKHTFFEKATNQDLKKSNVLKTDGRKYSHSKVKEIKEHESVIVIEDHTREHRRSSSLIAEHIQQVNENDVLAPKGAVISLALGLTATAITAALIACRLRVVRRRGKRGHGPYAHDADYLVNGMYL
ncbi:hypothetical protein KM043_014180 [Ampulex compressa]|nr:hypothetical protein KM043_014180 [Ampulex compressa]